MCWSIYKKYMWTIVCSHPEVYVNYCLQLQRYSISTGYDQLHLSLLKSSDVEVPFFFFLFSKKVGSRSRLTWHGCSLVRAVDHVHQSN